MAAAVTVEGSITCSHGGSPALRSKAKLTVNGKAVLPFEAVAELKVYVRCTFPPSGPPKPCRQTVAVTPNAGSSLVLTVGGLPVLLDALVATTDNPPADPASPNVTVSSGQVPPKLTAS
jgi:hypothetical protein